MNFDLEDNLNKYVKRNDLDSAIQIAESELNEIPQTDFHQIIGKSLLHMESELDNYISNFYSRIRLKYTLSFKKKLKAFYCEMNGFTINYDRWFIDLFSYSEIGVNDYDWLADYDYFTNKDLTLTGFETLQKVYEDFHENNKYKVPEIKLASEVTELLIILRLQELFRNTYRCAQSKKKKWAEIPMYVTAHDYEMIYQTKSAEL